VATDSLGLTNGSVLVQSSSVHSIAGHLPLRHAKHQISPLHNLLRAFLLLKRQKPTTTAAMNSMAIGMPTAVPIAVLEVEGLFVELDVDDELVAEEVLDMDEGDEEIADEGTVLALVD
jgi:hypothetical protein